MYLDDVNRLTQYRLKYGKVRHPVVHNGRIMGLNAGFVLSCVTSAQRALFCSPTVSRMTMTNSGGWTLCVRNITLAGDIQIISCSQWQKWAGRHSEHEKEYWDTAGEIPPSPGTAAPRWAAVASPISCHRSFIHCLLQQGDCHLAKH